MIFNGCTFADNSSTSTGGAINVSGGTVSFSGTTAFTGNSATSGGAISAAGAVSFAGGRFEGNKATGSGGAINAGSVTLTGTPSFTGNEAGADGGAINATGAVTLAGGTFGTNKATGNGGAINAATVALSVAVTFNGNTATGNGGAISTTSPTGSASLNGSTFSSNTAGQNGGAVYAAGSVTFTGGSFSSNAATGGSGGAIYAAGNLNPPATAAATFTGNTSFADGGAVYSGGNITLTGATFTGNRTTDSTGGGGAAYSVGNGTFTDCVFGKSGVSGSGNSAGNSGGAVSCGATLIADNCSFIDNTTQMDGGALYIQAAGMSASRIDGCLLTGNTAGKDGGAVHFAGTNLSIAFRRSLFSGNRSGTVSTTVNAGGGGAVYVMGTGTFDSCTFTGNTATAAAGTTRDVRGGAVYAAPTTGSTNLTNCTFTLNEARSMGGNSQGGALYVAGQSSMLYCTFTNANTSASRGTGKSGLGGGLYVSGGPLAITASAIAGNEASFGEDIFRDGGVRITSGGYNRLGTYGITSQGFATDYPWGSDSNITGARDYDQEGVTQVSMFGSGALSENLTSGVNVADITIGAAGEPGRLLTVALTIATTNPALDQIPYREGNLLATRVDQRNLQRPQPTNGLFDVGALEAEQAGGPGPDPDPDEYYVDYVKMSGIPGTMTKIGQTASLTAVVYPGRANQNVTWSSSQSNVARIDAYGNIVSLARGTTTISVTSVGMMSDGKRATDSVVLEVTDEMTHTNVHPDVWLKLGGYNSGLQQYAEQLYFADSDPAAVGASSFQNAFSSAYGVSATQVTELQSASAFDFGSQSAYTGDNWSSVKPSMKISMSSLPSGGGSLLPLEFTWSLSWDEVGTIMGRTVTTIDNATELFGKLKIVFEATDGATMPVVDQDGEYGVAVSNAVSSGVLALMNGNNGLTLTLDILLGDIGGNGGRPSLIDGRLVVADNVVDGTAGGSMWLLKRTGSGGGGSSGGGGGGGCDGGFGFFALALCAGVFLRRRALMGFLLCILLSGAAWALPYYQLRDVSGERDGHTVAGAQWFATVFDTRWVNNAWISYRDTQGGEAPVVPMVTSADLLYDFSSVYMEDPEHNTTMGDDVSFDPVESVYLVIPQGRGSMKIHFGNDYAQHNPWNPQPAMEDVLLSVPDYTTRVEPMSPQLVPVNAWLVSTLSFQADSPQNYGSTLGHLTFRQSASFDTGFTGYRESIKIPLVVANVYDGPASDAGNELWFDMTVFDSGDVVTRNRFRWGVDQDMTRDIGTFFTMRPAGAAMPVYDLETRITNRTGTRYRLQRYDGIQATYSAISPQSWAYDLTPDLYGSLPASFFLDAQSQIAPGLVTIYDSSLDMAYGSAESFRLYPYQGAEQARDLRLTFRKVGGMSPYGTLSASGSTPSWSVTAFGMSFADAIQNSDNTADEIAAYAGGAPVMPTFGFAFNGASDRYIRADAFSSFLISTDVPPGLVGSDDVGLLPVKIRMRVSRQESPVVGIWNDLADADSVIGAFANACAVWVRSDAAAELDMNLFTTLRNRGYSPEKCIQAFTYGDWLYLDFVVLLADAVSQNTGKTAFCQVVEDDKVPYILIGDGAVDGLWNVSFYVAPTGGNPEVDPAPDSKPSGGSGGGCNGGFGILSLGILLRFIRRHQCV